MTVAQMRIIIPDKEHYDYTTGMGDGTTLEFKVPQKPMVASSERVTIGGILQAFPADYSVLPELGLVTFTAAPGVGVAIVVSYRWTIISEDDLTEMLVIEDGDARCGAALALETIASNEAYVQKVIRVLDLSTNGPQTAKALMDRAALLRQQAAAAEDGEGLFDVAEMVFDDFSRRERIWKDALRNV